MAKKPKTTKKTPGKSPRRASGSTSAKTRRKKPAPTSSKAKTPKAAPPRRGARKARHTTAAVRDKQTRDFRAEITEILERLTAAEFDRTNTLYEIGVHPQDLTEEINGIFPPPNRPEIPDGTFEPGHTVAQVISAVRSHLS